MAQASANRSPIVDWLTVVAIAAIAISINVSFHEGVHALTCVAAGGDLREYSALHVDCATTAPWQDKVVAGSASIANIIVGTCLWLVLLRARSLWKSTAVGGGSPRRSLSSFSMRSFSDGPSISETA